MSKKTTYTCDGCKEQIVCDSCYELRDLKSAFSPSLIEHFCKACYSKIREMFNPHSPPLYAGCSVEIRECSQDQLDDLKPVAWVVAEPKEDDNLELPTIDPEYYM